MARGTHDSTDIYRSRVVANLHLVRPDVYDDHEYTYYYGPYDGSRGKGQARQRIADQHHQASIAESSVQKLTPVREECGCCLKLEWVDVDG